MTRGTPFRTLRAGAPGTGAALPRNPVSDRHPGHQITLPRAEADLPEGKLPPRPCPPADGALR